MIDATTVTKIARLARIRVQEPEKAPLAKEISGILQWIEQLAEVNTEGVPQLSSVSAMLLPWRADAVTDGDQQEAIVRNAPGSDNGCFVVPKVME